MADDLYFSLHDFQLECGVALPELRIAYRAEGNLSPARDNVIVTGTSFGATPDDLNFLIGPGKAIDTDRYFVVRTHMIGNGYSSSPSNMSAPLDGPRFPAISIRDNVQAQYRLLTEGLGIGHIRAYAGASMGAQQAYQWAVSYPDLMDWIVPIVGGAHTTPHGQAFLRAMRQPILDDPDFAGGDYTRPPARGLRTAGMIWLPWGYGQEFYAHEKYREHLGVRHESLEAFVAAVSEGYTARDANNYLCHNSVWMRHNVGDTPGFGGDLGRALASIRARALVIPSRTDTYFYLPDLVAEAEQVPYHRLRILDTVYGHTGGFGGTPADAAFINAEVADALAEG